MAKSTFLQLVNRTLQECGISGNTAPSVVGQTGMRLKVVTWVAEADLYIQRIYRDWNFLHSQYSTSTIPNTKDYVKPTDLGLWDVDSFYLNYSLATNTPLNELNYKEYRDFYGAGVQTSSLPGNFVIKPNKDIILYPQPDAVYTLTADYWKLPTKMTVDSSTSNIPEYFEDIIVRRAMILYAQHEEAGDMLTVAREEYAQVLDDLKANEAPYHTGKNQANFNETVQVI